jgi:hypothetical protein
MRINRIMMGLLGAAAFSALSTCAAFAEKITYTFSGAGDIEGTLGGVAIGGATNGVPNQVLNFTFVSDTLNVLPFTFANVHGFENLVGTASFSIIDTATDLVVAQGTFLPSDGIFISIDNVNGGVGFGSDGVLPTSPSFPTDPVYPFGIAPNTRAEPEVLSYDLKSSITLNGPNSLSCLGFPSICNTPTPLATTAGPLILGLNQGSDPFSKVDYGIFSATTVPEPSTWAMMLFGFAGIGLIGYRQTRKNQAVSP